MNKVTSEERAKKVLEPHLTMIESIYVESLSELNTVLGSTTCVLNKRSRSTLLHNFAIEKTKKYFGDNKDIEIIEKYSTIQIVFKGDQTLVGRFKKVNKKKLPSNIYTKRNDSISSQLSLFPFNVTYIDFGYRLNETGTDFDLIGVICRNGTQIEWDFEINTTTQQISISTESVQPEINKQLKVKRKNAKG